VITTAGDDSMYPSGINGLVIADLTSINNPVGVGADATFDNYRALSVEPPRLSAAYAPELQSLRVSWPGESTGFILEYSTTLPATTWTAVPAGGSASDRSGFQVFRLRRADGEQVLPSDQAVSFVKSLNR
jgi:hypothetical protein